MPQCRDGGRADHEADNPVQDTFAVEERCDVLCSRGLSGLLGAAGRQVRDRRRGICCEGRCAELRHAKRHSTEIFDTAEELPFDAGPPVVDVTAAFADQARNWSSALFPQKSKAPANKSDDNGAAASSTGEPLTALKPTEAKAQDRGLFVRRSINEPSR
jgi:hypothetical protein